MYCYSTSLPPPPRHSAPVRAVVVAFVVSVLSSWLLSFCFGPCIASCSFIQSHNPITMYNSKCGCSLIVGFIYLLTFTAKNCAGWSYCNRCGSDVNEWGLMNDCQMSKNNMKTSTC